MVGTHRLPPNDRPARRAAVELVLPSILSMIDSAPPASAGGEHAAILAMERLGPHLGVVDTCRWVLPAMVRFFEHVHPFEENLNPAFVSTNQIAPFRSESALD